MAVTNSSATSTGTTRISIFSLSDLENGPLSTESASRGDHIPVEASCVSVILPDWTERKSHTERSGRFNHIGG